MSQLPSLSPRAAQHAEVRRRSYLLLQNAREEAHNKRRYDSTASRIVMAEECAKRTGLLARPEQLDVAECMLLGLDAVCIAGTGWGKTLPFVLPLLVPQSRGKIVVIVSPLNALEIDQAARFQKMDVTAVALNANTCTPKLLKEVEQGKHSILVAGPKLLTSIDNPVRALFNNPKFTRKILGLVVDEAHCISQWGGDFRPEYAALDIIRALLPVQASVLATSATMPPLVLTEVGRTLRVQIEKVFVLNLGNNRRNITWEVRVMAGSKSDLEALAFLVPDNPTKLSTLTKAMVFFDDILVLMKAHRWLLSRLPKALHSRVKGYYSRRTELAKTLVMDDFVHGRVDILFATEAAGMGCDIPDIKLVAQFMVPESFTIWTQRAGRAGRRPDIQARAILLVQKSVFSEKGKKSRKEGEAITYVKEIEGGMRDYVDIASDRCLRDIADEYFDNPPRRESAYRVYGRLVSEA
ncbi:P-loop containing nucleoside triphosphate hydrolase protein [Lenzites betulinus]|nr:P-loop containing nucleoside triphosphate hydrolase protein [Lenzites betulinus]